MFETVSIGIRRLDMQGVPIKSEPDVCYFRDVTSIKYVRMAVVLLIF